ncbi:MAG: 3-isopropylmalate dehydratase [candidate division KSB1 bacterium]|nr:3-isopropylmalate dehydratase [candidate division KSB1 bacterium]
MQDKITGIAFVLGDNIDTDQIIPAQHLVYSMEKPEERRLYGRYALSSVPLPKSGLPYGGIPFVPADAFRSNFEIVVAGKNFGCGSSREHAPFALQMAGVKAVVARSYARIFYRNAVDGGFLIPFESEIDLSQEIRTHDLIEIDKNLNQLLNLTTGKKYPLKPLGEVAAIVTAGGIFEYARKHGLVK